MVDMKKSEHPIQRADLLLVKGSITERDAWAQCPALTQCQKTGMEHPCLECWDKAGDIVAGLRLKEISQTDDPPPIDRRLSEAMAAYLLGYPTGYELPALGIMLLQMKAALAAADAVKELEDGK